MNMQWIDWLIIFVLFSALSVISFICKRYVKGVAHFLVADRSVGRYLGMGSGAIMGLGAISMLGIWQMGYKSGFAGNWLWSFQYPVMIVLALAGFAIFRYRLSRAMTIPQLLEMRHSRRLRIFCGMLTYISGVVNMGIFPAVGAGFFVYFCGFPTQFGLAGMQIPTILPIMLVLVGVSVAICFLGGQVTLIITDFIQSVFVNIMLLFIVIIVYKTFTWQQFTDAYMAAPNRDRKSVV